MRMEKLYGDMYDYRNLRKIQIESVLMGDVTPKGETMSEILADVATLLPKIDEIINQRAEEKARTTGKNIRIFPNKALYIGND